MYNENKEIMDAFGTVLLVAAFIVGSVAVNGFMFGLIGIVGGGIFLTGYLTVSGLILKRLGR